MEQIKIGDYVQIMHFDKPKMVVEETNGRIADCVYLDGNQVLKVRLQVAVLEKVENKKVKSVIKTGKNVSKNAW